MLSFATRAARAFVAFPVSSQHAACRNALVAGTALAERRREREEVEDFVERHLAARAARGTLEVAVRGA